MKIGIPTVALIAVLASCGTPAGDDVAQNEAQPSKRFEGFLLKGNATEAKAMGFVKCDVDYYAATCRKLDAKLFGLTAPAVIRMELTDGKVPSDLAQLTYDGIEFDAPKLASTYPCDANPSDDPLGCLTPGPSTNFARKLVQDGWKVRAWKRNVYFTHPAHEAQITMAEETSLGSANGVSIAYMDRASVDEELSRIAKDQQARQSQATAANDLKNAMAGRSP